jgi:regulator of replication initiation timing
MISNSTHRERKESYIKSLETEVLQLHTNESKILHETKSLYMEIGRLKRLLDQHGIAYDFSESYTVPFQFQDSSSQASPTEDFSSVSVVSNPGFHQPQLHLHSSGQESAVEFHLSESDGSQSISKAPRGKLSSFFRGRERSDSRPSEGSSSKFHLKRCR